MTRVVVDTNVFISSFLGGKPKKIIDLWRNGKITICLSNKIVDEYVEVLRRMGLQNEAEIGELLGVFSEGRNIAFTASTPSLDIVQDDPDDNMFIECAVALKCPYIISGDRHLLAIKNYMGIRIMSPAEFLVRIPIQADHQI